MLIPEIQMRTWCTNLAAPPEDVIRLYREHGTCEQFHSELKTDNGPRTPAVGQVRHQRLMLLLAMMASNALRLCGQTNLREARRLPPEKHVTFRKKAGRRRLRTVILDLMYQAARWVRHGRRFGLSVRVFQPLVRCLETDLPESVCIKATISPAFDSPEHSRHAYARSCDSYRLGKPSVAESAVMACR